MDVVALSRTTPHRGNLAAAADAFLDHADLAATTRRVYRVSLAALVDGLDSSPATAELTGQLVEDGFRARYATVAPATWNRELATLRSGGRLVAGPRLAGHRPHHQPRAASGAPRPDPSPE